MTNNGISWQNSPRNDLHWDAMTCHGQVQWFTRNLEHLLNVQLSTKMSGLCAHVYVQERLLNEAVTGRALGKRSCNRHFLEAPEN